MKRLLIFLAVALLSVTASFGQTVSKNYNFSGFTQVKASSIYDVYIQQGNSYSIRVTCPERMEDYLKITSSQGVLKLEADFPRNFFNGNRNRGNNDKEKLIVHITMPKLEALSLSGACDAQVTGNFTCNVFTCNLSGSSDLDRINMTADMLKYNFSGASDANIYGKFKKAQGTMSGSCDVTFKADIAALEATVSGATDFEYYGNSQNIVVSASGSCDVKLNGKTGMLDLKCMGASNINARNMIAGQAAVSTSGSSDVVVHAEQSIKATASGASDITFYGNPGNVSKNKSGSASIHAR